MQRSLAWLLLWGQRSGCSQKRWCEGRLGRDQLLGVRHTRYTGNSRWRWTHTASALPGSYRREVPAARRVQRRNTGNVNKQQKKRLAFEGMCGQSVKDLRSGFTGKHGVDKNRTENGLEAKASHLLAVTCMWAFTSRRFSLPIEAGWLDGMASRVGGAPEWGALR